MDEIRTRIASGQLAPGEPIPSARAITREWGVALATATRVLAVLRGEGLVDARPGVGTVVARRSARVRRPRETSSSEVSVQRIVSAAIDIADVEGLAAVSMRRVAIKLGVATMALFRHVRGKNNLLPLMTDAILAQVEYPDTPPVGWRAQLELIARLQWAGYQQHPWLTRIISMTRPSALPNGMRHTEWALATLAGVDHGLDSNAMLHMVVDRFAYVRGSAMNVEMELESEQDTGLTDDQWLEAPRRALRARAGVGELSAASASHRGARRGPGSGHPVRVRLAAAARRLRRLPGPPANPPRALHRLRSCAHGQHE